MDNSIYVALSRQMNLFRNIETTANNIANTNTVGYHSEHTIFTDYLVNEGNRKTKLAFTQDIASWRDTSDGRLQQTGNPLDLAITGPGFFVVETGGGQRYTRAGNFTVGADGTVMTSAGYPVLDDAGQRIVIGDDQRTIRIGSNGAITSTDFLGQTQEIGTIGMVEFDDPQRLTRLNSQLYETDQQPRPAEISQMTQGALEMSNVSAIGEMVKVTELSRSNSSTAKMIEVMYDLTRKTSNAYARSSNQ